MFGQLLVNGLKRTIVIAVRVEGLYVEGLILLGEAKDEIMTGEHAWHLRDYPWIHC
jgi:hypothetical protein